MLVLLTQKSYFLDNDAIYDVIMQKPVRTRRHNHRHKISRDSFAEKSLFKSQSFSFLDKSTGPYLTFVALALSKICQCIFIMSLLSPLGKGHDPSFERPCRQPSPKDALCQVCLKLDQWFWRRCENFLKVCNNYGNRQIFVREALVEPGSAQVRKRWWSALQQDNLIRFW